MKICAECKYCVPDTANRRLCCLKHVDHVTGFPEFCRDVRFDGGCHDGKDWEARENEGKPFVNPEVPELSDSLMNKYESRVFWIGVALVAFAIGGTLGMCV